MWIPQTEAEIVSVVTSGTLEESVTFDAKREIPAKNPEIAKDIAAMANDGGVIIYGIAEDDQGRPTILTPIPLAGQRERIGSIVQTAIAEPPSVTVSAIPTTDDPSRGYIMVVVPPSERAPHMVIVKGDYRYYGRGPAGNVPLTEGEVARLYERRRQWAVDRDGLLAAELEQSPFPPRDGFAYLYVVVQPVIRDTDLLDRALRGGQTVLGMLQELVQQVSQPSVYPRIYSPDWYAPTRWIRRVEGPSGWLQEPGDMNRNDAPSNALRLQVDFDGSSHLFCGRAAERREAFYFFPAIVAGNTVRLLALLGQLYWRARYVGPVDACVAVTGLKGSVPHTQNMLVRHFVPPYDRDDYRRTARFAATTLKDDGIDAARRLLTPLFEAISQGRLDPFAGKIQA
jgi:hypothetical protein